jgi:hypothetical protein
VTTPAEGGCAVPEPAYDLTPGVVNRIVCIAYDPALPEVNVTINHLFIPLDFTISVIPWLTAVVGELLPLEVGVTNRGLLTDTYQVMVSSAFPQQIAINGQPAATAKTAKLTTGTSDKATFGVQVLYATEEMWLTVNVSSQTDPTAFKQATVELRTGMASLPGLGVAELLRLVALALVIWLLNLRKN